VGHRIEGSHTLPLIHAVLDNLVILRMDPGRKASSPNLLECFEEVAIVHARKPLRGCLVHENFETTDPSLPKGLDFIKIRIDESPEKGYIDEGFPFDQGNLLFQIIHALYALREIKGMINNSGYSPCGSRSSRVKKPLIWIAKGMNVSINGAGKDPDSFEMNRLL